MEEDIRKETLRRVAHELAAAGRKQNAPLGEDQIIALLEQEGLYEDGSLRECSYNPPNGEQV